LTSALCLLLAARAFAVDGLIEINQARALAGGVTASDTAGFPVTLDTARSYILTGNLSVSNAADHGIEITANDVTVDLNGFTVSGTTTCTGTGSTLSCSPSSPTDGVGVFGSPFGSPPARTAVKNGVVRGFSAGGVRLGDECQVTGLRTVQNGGAGITVDTACRVSGNVVSNNEFGGISATLTTEISNNTASGNDGFGISSGTAGLVNGNTVRLNDADGIFGGTGSSIQNNASSSNTFNGISCAFSCSVHANLSTSNTLFGLSLGASTGYTSNVIDANTGGTVSSGVDGGDNVCDGSTICP
jgi:parallel beta-helix repeat protein